MYVYSFLVTVLSQLRERDRFRPKNDLHPLMGPHRDSDWHMHAHQLKAETGLAMLGFLLPSKTISTRCAWQYDQVCVIIATRQLSIQIGQVDTKRRAT